MTSDLPLPDKAYLNRALEVSIHVCLFVLLAAVCLLILRPFIALAVWGLIISIAGYPGYCKLQKLLGGRGRLASVLFTVLLLAVLIVPIALLLKCDRWLPVSRGTCSQWSPNDSAAAGEHRNVAPARQTVERSLELGFQ